MADISVLDVSQGTASDSIVTASITAASATQTIPYDSGKDGRLTLMLINDDNADATVILAAGGGLRAPIGSLTYTSVAGETAVVNLSDSARYKVFADNDIDVGITTNGTIGSVFVLAIQT